MYDIVLSFITAFILVFLAIPSIINIARVKHLYDVPDQRKSHSEVVPTLGGVAIFAGVIFSIILWTPFDVFGDLQYILCSFIIIFLIGAKDDILPMSPYRKMAGQIFACFILVFKAQVRLTSLYGIFGIYSIPEIPSIILSIFTILVIINAFNLIDGINGLTGSLATLISVTLGTWFFLVDRTDLAIIAFALAGATIAFLKYNITPARIFMGDTGSMLIGLISAILVIEFIEVHAQIQGSPYAFRAVPAVAVGILILPLFDTLRVFILRIFKKKSPLHPDRSHIHHLLLESGLTHMQATAVLILVNLAFIFFVISFQSLGNLKLLILILVMASALTAIPYYIIRTRKPITDH
ncbi:MAG TPA: MraY family glycosyltransferase [Saprospiraceae bacterium]|nr:MraY family glycosyltransferase [Saprospiraceae bacterium]